MIMTFGTLHRHRQHGSAKSIGAVGYILHPIFFINHPTLFGYFMVSVEATGQLLFIGCIGQQITRQLPGYKSIVAHVAIKGINYPIAPRPLRTITIILKSV